MPMLAARRPPRSELALLGEDRVKGLVLGCALGDAVGLATEPGSQTPDLAASLAYSTSPRTCHNP